MLQSFKNMLFITNEHVTRMLFCALTVYCDRVPPRCDPHPSPAVRFHGLHLQIPCNAPRRTLKHQFFDNRWRHWQRVEWRGRQGWYHALLANSVALRTNKHPRGDPQLLCNFPWGTLLHQSFDSRRRVDDRTRRAFRSRTGVKPRVCLPERPSKKTCAPLQVAAARVPRESHSQPPLASARLVWGHNKHASVLLVKSWE